MIYSETIVDSTLLDSCDLNTNDYSGINRVFLCIPLFYFDTVAKFETQSEWETEITAENIYAFDRVSEVIDLSEGAVYNKSVNGQQNLVRDGRVIHEYHFNYSDSFHRVLKKFDQGKYEVLLSDRNGNIYGVSDDGVTVRGCRVNVLNVQKRNFANSSKVFSVLRVEYSEEFTEISNVDWMKDNLVTI